MMLFDGNKLYTRRKSCGLTLEGLANKIDSSKSYIWEMEDGRSCPSGDKLYMLAKALKVKMEYFFTKSGAKT